jgi:hypothetical protein
MGELPEEAILEIERIHARWMEFEAVGTNHSLMELCADDIELWPPDAKPILGRMAVAAWMTRGPAKIHRIEITDRRIRGSNQMACLTANYTTTFSLIEDHTFKQACGSHLWIMERRSERWVVVLVSWSSWSCGAIAGSASEIGP